MASISDEYVAGLFDGEGTVRITKHQKNAVYHYGASIDSTTPIPLRLIQQEYGGRLRTYSSREPTRKPMWKWEVCGEEATLFLERVRPHLLIKHKQADLALKLGYLRRRWTRWTDDLRQEAASLKEEMHILNRVGV